MRSSEFAGCYLSDRRNAEHRVDLPNRAGPLVGGAKPGISQFDALPDSGRSPKVVCDQQAGVNNIEPLGTEHLTACSEALSAAHLVLLEDVVLGP
jgi:hypothetical protein